MKAFEPRMSILKIIPLKRIEFVFVKKKKEKNAHIYTSLVFFIVLIIIVAILIDFSTLDIRSSYVWV